MSKKVVYLLGHQARVGKDTLAEKLHYYRAFQRFAFADKLKQTAADLFDLSPDQVTGDLKDVEDQRYPNTRDCEFNLESFPSSETGRKGTWDDVKEVPNPDYKPFLTPRRIFQFFGQDQRSLYEDIWAQYVFNQIDRHPFSNFAITDFRFPNEYAEIGRASCRERVSSPV